MASAVAPASLDLPRLAAHLPEELAHTDRTDRSDKRLASTRLDSKSAALDMPCLAAFHTEELEHTDRTDRTDKRIASKRLDSKSASGALDVSGLPAALREELANADKRLCSLQRDRGARVAELTRLSEALACHRHRQREAESEAVQVAARVDGLPQRRVEMERTLAAASQRLELVRARCVSLQATTPEPRDVSDVPPEVKPLQERALSLERALAAAQREALALASRKAELQSARVVDTRDEEMLQSQVIALGEVYDRADHVLQDLPRTASGDVDPEEAVLALARSALPLVPFTSGSQALAHLRLMGRQLRPALLPAGSADAANQLALIGAPGDA